MWRLRHSFRSSQHPLTARHKCTSHPFYSATQNELYLARGCTRSAAQMHSSPHSHCKNEHVPFVMQPEGSGRWFLATPPVAVWDLSAGGIGHVKNNHGESKLKHMIIFPVPVSSTLTQTKVSPVCADIWFGIVVSSLRHERKKIWHLNALTTQIVNIGK